MFALRKILPDNSEINIALGNSYTYIGKHRECFAEELKKSELPYDEKEISGIIYADGKPIALFAKHRNYIMTERGKTFARV